MVSKHARELRRNPTETEKRLWAALRRRQLDERRFRRQVPIGPYIVDFLCYEERLIIELDGGQHAKQIRDTVRTRWLETQGFNILRFWNNDVFENMDGVLETIRRSFKSSPPP